MKNVCILLTIISLIMMFLTSGAFATNGDNLIAIGSIARAMGGVGIAAPQDAISAVFANPASMCTGPFCPASEFDFSGTLFIPSVKAEVDRTSGTAKADSKGMVYSIPAIGVSVPITDKPTLWRFGIAAYGVSGLGVDYRGTNLDNAAGFDFGGGVKAPLIQGEFTQLQILKFAPAIAVQPVDNLSFGGAIHIDYATLDLRHGSSPNYGAGVQLGALYTLSDAISLGLNYTSPQRVTHKNIIDFNQDGKLDSLKLEAPQQIGLGAAYKATSTMNLLIEADAKWVNWAGAEGYSDFDWRDQWVYAIGAQVEPVSHFFLRAGYNYANNPLKKHNGFDGSFNPGTGLPNSTKNVQGKVLPTYYYETFRIIGFPAIVEQHICFGFGYRFSNMFSADLGYTHAFVKTFSESGTDLFGQPVTLKSSLSEDSIDFGLRWFF